MGALLVPINLNQNPSHFGKIPMNYHRVLFDLLRFILIGFLLAVIRKQFDRNPMNSMKDSYLFS